MVAYTHYESDPRVRREAEALAARGDEVVVWCLAGEGASPTEVLDGVTLRRVAIPRYRGGRAVAYAGSYGRFLVEVSLRLGLAHAREAFDLVHVHTMPDFMVFAGLLPRLAGAKLLLDMHDLMPDLYAVKFGLPKGGVAVRALRGVQQLSTAVVDAVICVHEPQYELLLRDGVPTHKLGIVMNCADPRLFPPRKKQPRVQPEGPIRVVYHGTVLHRYGVDLAVRALAEARRTEPRLVMKVLGDGDFLPEVRRVAAELGLGPEVLDLPGRRLPLPEVAQAIRDAHMGIIPNRDDQEDSVLPTKLLEYVSVGIPAIAPRTRCISRYFDDREVELVPVEDVSAMAAAMVRLAREPDRVKALVAAARGWEARHGYETQMRLLTRTVDHLCWEKVRAQRRARQAEIDGVKTGRRQTPPKS
jgi:glycosyltransferase involved in cell wall biosynthesis